VRHATLSAWLRTTLGDTPEWVRIVLGFAAVVVGIVLVLRPWTSLSAIVVLAVVALIVSGIGELAIARQSRLPWLTALAGVALICGGLIALAWPQISVGVLAVIVGIAMLAVGAARCAAGFRARTDARVAAIVGGLATVIFGLLVLAWPTVTLFVIAVVFGARTAMFGLGLVIDAITHRTGIAPVAAGPRSRWRRIGAAAGAALALVVALALLLVTVALHAATPAAPGAFYRATAADISGPPGTVIRTQPIAGLTPTSTGYRVLYVSTGYDGRPAAVSGVIFVPDGPAPAGGRNVVDITHGTTGVASNCAPSLVANQSTTPVANFGGAAFLDAGDVVAATDYQGLGTAGPHPYLIGAAAAMDALDIVRAAHNLPQAHASTTFVVWGHSQGGQASLFTGELAASYAPDLHLKGVAAGAPVPNLEQILKNNIASVSGRVLISYALTAWAATYRLDLASIVTPLAAPLMRQIATSCLSSPDLLGALPDALALGTTFFTHDPWTVAPWKDIISKNDPGQTKIAVPMLITQGAIDPTVAPQLTRQLVTRLCAFGQPVDFDLMPGVAHADGGSRAAPMVEAWTAARFAGTPAPSVCASG